MASGGFFRGTSVDQDARFFNQNKKLLAKLSFPANFEQKVDLTKVKREVIGQWITERVTQLLGFEDDIVVAMIINLLEPKVDERLDPRQLQLTLTGFLEKDAPKFMEELWGLLLSAQAHPTGIPPAILEKKKQEMAQAAHDKRELRDVLDRKRQDTGTTQSSAGREAATSGKPPQPYGLSHPHGTGRGGRNSAREREGPASRDRSHPRDSRRGDHRRASPVRERRRGRSRSPSRSPSRSTSRSHSRGRRGARRSRSNSRDRPRRARARRLPSSSPERGRRRTRRQSRSPSGKRRDRVRSPSLDQFGRSRRRTLSKSPSRSSRKPKRGRSRSASD